MNHRMAFSIGGEDRPDWLIVARWQAFAEDIAVRPDFILDELRDAAIRLPAMAAAVADRFQHKNGFAAIHALITQRAHQILVSLEAEDLTA